MDRHLRQMENCSLKQPPNGCQSTSKLFKPHMHSLLRRWSKKDLLALAGGSSGGLSVLRLPLPLNGRKFNTEGLDVAEGAGKVTVSTPETGELGSCIPRPVVKSGSVERRMGAVRALTGCGIELGICSFGSYSVRIFPLAIILAVDSHSRRKSDVFGILWFTYGFKRVQLIL